MLNVSAPSPFAMMTCENGAGVPSALNTVPETVPACVYRYTLTVTVWPSATTLPDARPAAPPCRRSVANTTNDPSDSPSPPANRATPVVSSSSGAISTFAPGTGCRSLVKTLTITSAIPSSRGDSSARSPARTDPRTRAEWRLLSLIVNVNGPAVTSGSRNVPSFCVTPLSSWIPLGILTHDDSPLDSSLQNTCTPSDLYLISTPSPTGVTPSG